MTTRQRCNCGSASAPAASPRRTWSPTTLDRTTRKLRIVTQRQQQVARVDFETDADLDQSVAARVAAAVAAHAAHADVVLVSDYLKGCITADTMAAVLHAATPRGIAVLVDPKIPHLDLYRGVTLVTPNQVEAETATHARIRTDDEARDAARRLRERLACASVVITRGEQGMWVLDGSTTPATEANFAATALEVSDVTGAGDTVIGTLALALAAKAIARRGRAALHGRRRRRGEPVRAGRRDARRTPGQAHVIHEFRSSESHATDLEAGGGEAILKFLQFCNCLVLVPKCRRPVNTMVIPCSSAASITS